MSKSIAFILGLLLGVFSALCCFKIQHSKSDRHFADTIHTIIHDTTHYRMPIAYDSVVIRYQNKYAVVNKTVIDTITVTAGDSIPVVIPITQKAYKDSAYEAWVSGYEPKLDSINVFSKTVIQTITKPIANKRWGLGINAGYGYANGNFGPYIGIGVQYNLIKW